MRFLFLFLFFFSALVRAQTGSGASVNEVLFSVAGESSTSRDKQVYEAVLDEVFQKTRISRFSLQGTPDFLLSRLSVKEAALFDMVPPKVKVSEASHKKLSDFSAAEIDREVDFIGKALLLIELKENQLKEQERFDKWFETLRSKYQVKFKTPDSK